MKRLLLLLVLAVSSTAARAAEGGFLFVTFKGEASPMTEQIYFGTSSDGLQWEQTNGGEPVLVSQLGEKGVRDPFIMRSADGKKFFILATDLSINLHRDWTRATQKGSRSLVIWESNDLVHWSEPRLVPVAPGDAGCTWAPEAVYDPETKDYLVFWASKTGSDHFAKHRIWAARTTDFITFGKPFIYIEKESDIIDTTIVRENGQYYRFSKDEKSKAIIAETSTKVMGPWTEQSSFSLGTLRGYEGPTCFVMKPAAQPGQPATWCLLLDYYSRGQGYQPYVTKDLKAGQFTALTEAHFPYKFRHGSVLPISAAEMQRVKAAYPNTAPKAP
ncbi:MAG: glycoside hydrolase family 43 protein [Chthoniobacterales bacterium]